MRSGIKLHKRFRIIQEYLNQFHPKVTLLAILVTGFMLRFFMIQSAGIGVDEGIYFYEAREILTGSIPYKDFFKMKPAGMIYIISLLFSLVNISLI